MTDPKLIERLALAERVEQVLREVEEARRRARRLALWAAALVLPAALAAYYWL